MRDINDLKLGLVLSGGGAKGAYEVGVIAALWDLGLTKNILAVSGTSIGTVNALLFCMEDRKLLEDAWRSLQYSQFMTVKEIIGLTKIPTVLKSWFELRQAETLGEDEDYHSGIFAERGIRNFIEKYIDMQKLKQTSIDLYGCAYNVSQRSPTYFHLNEYNEDEIVDICLASCAIPDLISPIEINHEPYIDGGFHCMMKKDYCGDNVPIKPLKDYDCDIMIVVHLDYLEKVNPDDYPNRAIVEIFPSVPLEIANGFGTLNLFKDTIERRIDLGYRDALVSLAPILLAYFRGESLKHYLAHNHEKSAQLLEIHRPLPIEIMDFIQNFSKDKK